MSKIRIARHSFMQFWKKRKRRDFFVADNHMPFKSEWMENVFAKQKELFQDCNRLDDFQFSTV